MTDHFLNTLAVWPFSYFWETLSVIATVNKRDIIKAFQISDEKASKGQTKKARLRRIDMQ